MSQIETVRPEVVMSLEDAPEPTTREAALPPANAFGMLLAGTGSWFGFWGGQMVIFQWLLVERLATAPEWVGAAQMALSIPALAFLLVGGAVADRIDPKRLILGVHAVAGALLLALIVLVATDALSYGSLIVYALAMGTTSAFGFPARDTLLSDVVDGSMSRAVTGTTLTQHTGQFLGALLAGAANSVGSLAVLFGQTLLVLLGIWPLGRLPHRAHRHVGRRLSLHELRAGIVEVVRSPILGPVLIFAIETGVLFVGPYLVLIPLMVRDVYGGGAAEIGLLNAMFPLGSVLGGVAILRRGGLVRTGRALCLGQVLAAFSIASMSLGLPFWGSMLAVFGWGLAGAFFINAGRTLFQTHASQAHRARVLSVYSLGVMGGAPLGSVISGGLVEPLSLHGTLLGMSSVALLTTLSIAIFSGIWEAR